MLWKTFRKTSYVFLSLLMTFDYASALDKQHADVQVVNKTGKVISYVQVLHKYSNVYTDDLAWYGTLANGDKTTSKVVDYNTGALTTGRDWWYIAWVDTDSSTIHYSDPTNFRGIIDIMETYSGVVIPIAATVAAAAGSAACAAATAGACAAAGVPATVSVASAAGAAIASAASGKLLEDGGTKGFKQHILRSEDANKTVKITLNSDNTIEIKSKSGVSKTVWSSKKITVTPSQEEALKKEIAKFKKNNEPDLQRVWDSSYGKINFKDQIYGENSSKTIRIVEKEWDEGKQAIRVLGVWGSKGIDPVLPKKNGSFTFYFKKCSFTGTWQYLIPEMVIVNGIPKFKTSKWTGSDPACK